MNCFDSARFTILIASKNAIDIYIFIVMGEPFELSTPRMIFKIVVSLPFAYTDIKWFVFHGFTFLRATAWFTRQARVGWII